MAEAVPIVETAQQALQHLLHGVGTGEWESFWAMVSDDIVFWFPVGPYHGHNQGKERLQEFCLYVSQTFGQGLTYTVERVTSNATTVVFEIRDEGLMRGEPYKNRVALSFDVKDGKICGYREYFGSDGQSN